MLPGTEQDAELVARCREGDESAWAELVERFTGYVHAILARGFGLVGHDAEDVFQEVFARLYERVNTIRDDEAIRGWIAQTARRCAIDRYRAGKREGPSSDDSPPEPGELDQRIERLDEAMEIRDALGELPDTCAEILTRFFILDESYRSISEATDLPQGTIASRISRCLGKLREQLEGSGEASIASGEMEGGR